MREKIVDIIAPFLKLNPDQLNDQSVIDRSALANSIMVHRMYARLAKEGFEVVQYWDIRTLGDLLKKLDASAEITAPRIDFQQSNASIAEKNENNQDEIGIDAEMIQNFQMVADFREDSFYKMNFAAEEISWCLLQKNPLQSFAGLFAAKEAIVKADNSYINTPFNQILIDHLPSGKPIHSGFNISITHVGEMAIAVAVSKIQAPHQVSPIIHQEKSNSLLWLFVVIAILLAAFSLLRSLI